jgi:hypothetical protein
MSLPTVFIPLEPSALSHEIVNPYVFVLCIKSLEIGILNGDFMPGAKSLGYA